MILAMDEEWVYCFDSYQRMTVRGLKGNVKVLTSDGERAPNLKIKRDWLDNTEVRRFCLGPVLFRECLLIWRCS